MIVESKVALSRPLASNVAFMYFPTQPLGCSSGFIWNYQLFIFCYLFVSLLILRCLPLHFVLVR